MTNQTKSGYAPNSDQPPLGWPITIPLGAAVVISVIYQIAHRASWKTSIGYRPGGACARFFCAMIGGAKGLV